MRSIVVGSGGSSFPLDLGERVREWVEASDLEQMVGAALTGIASHALPEAIREDYLSSYEGDRFVESMRYVRTYPTELRLLRDVLPEIQTPVQIIAGAHDIAVPPSNAEYLDERLPRSRLDILDAGHYTWEDAPSEYAALLTKWWHGGYVAAGSEGSDGPRSEAGLPA